MNEQALPTDRRAQMVSLTGLIVQLLLFAAVLALGLWPGGQSDAVLATARHLLGGVPIWLILFLVYTQRRRSRLEDLETEELRRAQESGLATNIFDVADEEALLERRRLAWTYRFLIPTFSVILAVYHVIGTLLVWPWSFTQSLLGDGWLRADDPFVPMIFVGAVAFMCFVGSRYTVGMARQSGWRLLRAGGSYLMGNALTCTLTVVAFALAGSNTAAIWAEPLAAMVIRAVLLLLGLEFVVNFILEFYRPRHPSEEEIRPAFDSRLLGLFSEPGGIVRSIAETINYQFGFEVSSTWFYKLIQRSLFPLAVLTGLALVLLSSIVIIDVDEQAYVERFGRIVQARGEPLAPGIHAKFPWPIDQVVRARVDQVRSLTVGSHRDVEPDHSEEDHAEEGGHHHEKPIIWTESHDFNPEMMTVVANPRSEGRAQGAAENGTGSSAGVSLLMLSVSIEYRVKDLYDFAYSYRAPERVLESIAHQELADYAAGHNAHELMGAHRERFGEVMRRRLQDRCDTLALGVDVTFVALQDAHPPSKNDVAATFQRVVAAEIQKAAEIEEAHGEHNRILTLTAGSVDKAKQLDAAIREMDRLASIAEREGTPEAREAAEQAERNVADLLVGNPERGIGAAGGLAAAMIARADAVRAARVSSAESKSRTFANDVAAWQAAPDLFKVRRYLAMLRDTLPGVRKFVFTGRADSRLIIEYVTQERATLDLETAEIPTNTE